MPPVRPPYAMEPSIGAYPDEGMSMGRMQDASSRLMGPWANPVGGSASPVNMGALSAPDEDESIWGAITALLNLIKSRWTNKAGWNRTPSPYVPPAQPPMLPSPGGAPDYFGSRLPNWQRGVSPMNPAAYSTEPDRGNVIDTNPPPPPWQSAR